MSDKSRIEWTDSTWNPVTGCSKVSLGCKNCYAETFAERWRGIPGHPYEQGFDLRLWPGRLTLPLIWKEPRMIFVNSMSDLFHEKVSDDFICEVFKIMAEAKQHTFQVLTKRSKRMLDWSKKYIESGFIKNIDRKIPPHIWIGVSVESQDYITRISDLIKIPAEIRFLSLEPLLAPLKISSSYLQHIRWVIVGGESGAKARPMHPLWVHAIQQKCAECEVAFFFKQWGVFNSKGERVGRKAAGRELDGKIWDGMPQLASI